jgi:hypothetical protein
MIVAIVIGFYYKDSLPGVFVDIFNTYNFCMKSDWKTYILSDIDLYKLNNGIREGVISDKINSGITNFMNESGRDNVNIHNKFVINNTDQLLNCFYNILLNEDIDKIFFYYSGHGENNCIVLPDDSVISFDEIRNIFFDKGNVKDIFIILDCCNPSHFNLPFILEDKIFRLNGKLLVPTRDNIILLSSSLGNGESGSVRAGSFFTGNLYKQIIDCDGYLPSISENITEKIREKNVNFGQTVSVYSSFNIVPFIWEWVFKVNDQKNYRDIFYDPEIDSIVVKNKNE